MKGMVVYDSVFGNTEQVARAIGTALAERGEVETRPVTDVNRGQLMGLAFHVVGSPTRQFRPTGAVTELLKRIPKQGLQGVKVAAFDTRFPASEIQKNRILAFFVRIFGYAAKPILDRLTKKGGDPVADPEGFYVEGVEGPLAEGELERAAAWARGLLGE
jgi:flavodoxin